MLLSASVERCFVSRMRDILIAPFDQKLQWFFWTGQIGWFSKTYSFSWRSSLLFIDIVVELAVGGLGINGASHDIRASVKRFNGILYVVCLVYLLAPTDETFGESRRRLTLRIKATYQNSTSMIWIKRFLSMTTFG